MVGVATRVEDLHGDPGPLVLVHRLGHVPVDAHLVRWSWSWLGWFICHVHKGGRQSFIFHITSRELVSLAAKGDSFPCRFGAMPPVTMRPTPFLALPIQFI